MCCVVEHLAAVGCGRPYSGVFNQAGKQLATRGCAASKEETTMRMSEIEDVETKQGRPGKVDMPGNVCMTVPESNNTPA